MSTTAKPGVVPLTKEMLKAGTGIAFFTPTGFVEELKAGQLVYVPLAEPELSQSEIGLLVHRDRHAWPAVRALSSRLVQEFEDLQREVHELDTQLR